MVGWGGCEFGESLESLWSVIAVSSGVLVLVVALKILLEKMAGLNGSIGNWT